MFPSSKREANETSSFGDQVEEYACLYTSRVSNLQYYSPQQHFRSPRDVMAHEMTTGADDTLRDTVRRGVP